jgi:hypothetical protein
MMKREMEEKNMFLGNMFGEEFNINMIEKDQGKRE